MKSRLFKKQIAFIQIAITMFFFCGANAQIIYTDIPDTTITGNGEKYYLDLNNDGANDFIIKHDTALKFCGGICGRSIATDKASVNPLLGSGIAVDIHGLPSAMNEGDSISPSVSFDTIKNQILSTTEPACKHIPFVGWVCAPEPNGHWSGVFNKYLGLQLSFGGNHYYGWARLDVTVGGYSFTLKDYAYNATPNQVILAGDTGGIATGFISSKNQNHFSVYPNPASNKIMFTFSSAGIKEIQIINPIGKIVFSEKINTTKQAIDISQFPKGMYLISVKTEEQNLESKFLKH